MESIDSQSFRASVCQATIFTPDNDHTTSRVMSAFYPPFAALFDADPEVVPNLPGFPAEVPRIILKNKDQSLRMEIAAGRLNFFRSAKRHKDLIDIAGFYTDAIKLFADFKKITDCRIGRLAAVRTVYTITDDPGISLARHFCKESWIKAPLNRPENLELHSHKTFELYDHLKVNSWVRAKTGTLTTEDVKAKIILVEQDLNTMGEEAGERSFNHEEFERFFKRIMGEFEHILNLYFPGLQGEKS